MRQPSPPRHYHRPFIRGRFGFLRILALIGLAGVGWFSWARSLPPETERGAPTDSTIQSVIADTSSPTPRLLIVQRAAGTTAPISKPPPIRTDLESVSRPLQSPATNTATVNPGPAPSSNNPALDPVFMGQIALANLGFSPGPIDGLLGSQTRGACAAFQQRQGLPISAQLDTATRAVLLTNNPSLTNYIITAADLARLAPVPDTWLGKSLAGRLGHSNIVELLAEKGWAYQSFVRRLNPSIQWNSIAPGTEVRLPDAHSPQFPGKASRVRIFLAQRTLQAFDEADRIIVHFPCSIAQRMDKRPLGDLRVTVVVSEPDYTFDPEVFPESEEGQQLGRRLRIPPGPNNPVGLAWIGLDRPGYGIHGTPDPEKVGRTESHGCFRLANWNAVMLLDLAWEGMPVSVLP